MPINRPMFAVTSTPLNRWHRIPSIRYATCIYRVVQEAVNNAARHSKARTVEVTVRREHQKVNDKVQQDVGAGFDSRLLRGLGLLGMDRAGDAGLRCPAGD